MSLLTRSLVKWLPLGVAITLVIGAAYVFVQQSYRQGANDPQIMVAHDIAARMASGVPADQLVSNEKVDPSKSLAPFVLVLDAGGKVVVSSADLGGAAPTPPVGVLNAARASGENRVTWQPRSDTRIASVVVAVKGGTDGFVLAGRSLKVAEERVDQLGQLAGAAWLATVAGTLVVTFFAEWLEERRVVRAWGRG